MISLFPIVDKTHCPLHLLTPCEYLCEQFSPHVDIPCRNTGNFVDNFALIGCGNRPETGLCLLHPKE